MGSGEFRPRYHHPNEHLGGSGGGFDIEASRTYQDFRHHGFVEEVQGVDAGDGPRHHRYTTVPGQAQVGVGKLPGRYERGTRQVRASIGDGRGSGGTGGGRGSAGDAGDINRTASPFLSRHYRHLNPVGEDGSAGRDGEPEIRAVLVEGDAGDSGHVKTGTGVEAAALQGHHQLPVSYNQTTVTSGASANKGTIGYAGRGSNGSNTTNVRHLSSLYLVMLFRALSER